MKKLYFILLALLTISLIVSGNKNQVKEDIWDQIQANRIAHYDAESLDLDFGKRVITWPDISGSGHHAFQPDPFYRPTYVNSTSGPVLRFDHQGFRVFFYEDLETKETLKEYAHPATMIIIFKFNRSGNHSIIDGASHLNRNRLVFDAGMGNRLFLTNYPEGPWINNQAGFTFTKGQDDLNLAVCIFNGTQSKLRVNMGEQEATGNVGNRPLTGFNLGGHAAIDGGHHEWAMTADIAEIIFFDDELTALEIGILEEHLALKWGLEVKYSLNLIADPSNGGSVSGAGSFTSGTLVQLTATPNEGFAFVHWQNEAQEILSTESEFTYTIPENNSTITAKFEVAKSTKGQLSNQVQLYPNPVKDEVIITSGTQINSIVISDISGKLVYQNTFNNLETRISTNKFVNGIYNVRIYTDDNIVSKKLSVQR